MNEMLDDDERYAAIARRDPEAGFFFAVRTTGVYCRARCAARTPLRRNVTFFFTPDAAKAAGFRPCKRCRPDSASADALAEVIDAACRSLEGSDEALSLTGLAANAGVSAFHFQRAFKKRVGVSPKQYQLGIRERRLEAALERASSVTEAALDAGFASSTGMYESGGVATSMRPRTYRSRGAGERIAYATTRTSLGWLLIAATPRGICALDLDDDVEALEKRLRERFAAATLVAADAKLTNAMTSAIAVIEGHQTGADLPLDIRGSAFQRRVWQELRTTAPGMTRTYAEIATAIGAPASARAVGNAIGSNALAVAIPCHRIVRGDGAVGGYRWGIERVLLERERKTLL